MQSAPTVYIIEDDPAVRSSLEWLIGSAGLRVQSFADAELFLAAYEPSQPGCVVADMCLPGASAVELQHQLAKTPPGLPVIIITGENNISNVVEAMRCGAVDCLEKPLSDQRLLSRVHAAITLDGQNRRNHSEKIRIMERIRTLTPREREVMQRVVGGAFTRQIAEALSLSVKTVEAHRGRMMQKMQADGIAGLVRMVEQIGDLSMRDIATDE